MTFAIETRQLTRTFGDRVALRQVDLAVPEGAIYGYLGLNGAGKSTTIRILTTLLEPTSGTARVCGHDVREDPLAVRRAVALVGDEDGGLARPSWTASEYVAYFARLRGLPSPAHAAHRALDVVGLDVPARRRAIGGYSTGMRRRVEFARALLGEPRVLFLDEPTRGLDLPAKREMWDLLRQLADERGVTIFLSSHETAEIRALCGALTVLHAGRVAYAGPARALGEEEHAFEASLIRLLRNPQTPPAARPGVPA